MLRIKSNYDVEKVIHQIYCVLEKNAQNNLRMGIGGLVGRIGECLFRYYYQDLFGFDRKEEEVICNYINEMIKTINEQKVSNYFIDGISGLGWGISFFYRNSPLLKDALSPLLPILDGHVISCVEEAIKSKHDDIDSFEGLIGYGSYFIERHKAGVSYSDQIKAIVSVIERKRIIKNNKVFWVIDEDITNIDFSVAHGTAMMLLFLGKVYTIHPNLVSKETLIEIVNFIFSYRENDNLPDALENNIKIFSPLRWCHGEMGICIALFYISYILEDKQLREKTTQIALACSRRLDIKEENLPHAIICHGTIGVSHIFNKFYSYTNNKRFRKAANYWLNQGINQLQKEGLYKYSHQERGVLFGIEGIGLGLLSSLSPKPLEWDALMMMD